MKKITSVLILVVMLLCSIFAVTGCGDADANAKTSGVQYKKFKGDDFYTVYGYEGEVTDSTLDLGALDVEIKAIDDFAFEGLKGVEKIIVPNTVEKIGAEAFCEMPDLKELVVPFIGKTANGGNGEVRDTASAEDKSVDLQRTIYYWFCGEEYVGGAQISGVKYNEIASESSFYLPKGLETITLNCANDYVIPAYALYNNLIIKTLNLSENVKSVGVNALYGCKKLTSVKKGDNEHVAKFDYKKGTSVVTELN